MEDTMQVLTPRRAPDNLAEIVYNLCVNFLMYVVLILVFYMLVRFYLEEDVAYDGGHAEYARVPTCESAADEGLELHPSVVEDNANEDEGAAAVAGKKDATPNKVERGSAGTYDLSTLASANIKPPGLERGSAGTYDLSTLAGANIKSPGLNKGTISTPFSNSFPKRRKSFLNVHDHEEDEPPGTKEEVIRSLIFCAVGFNVSFSVWGLLQERILTQTYGGEFFEFSYGLVFINRLGGLVLSSCLFYYYKVDMVLSPLWEYSFPSVANMLSSWCQYEALKYVSFPTQMLAKAFKMVPVLLLGKFLNNKRYESSEYVIGAVVGFGLFLFLSSSEKINMGQNVFGDPESVTGAWCGVFLLVLFLFFDAFTSQWQTRMFQLHKEMSPLQMMLITNAFSTVFAFITLVHQEQLSLSLSFVVSHPEIILHLILFCVCSTVGQLFIFFIVKQFGAVVLSIIMAVRILISTLLSCYVYSHPITELGIVGIAIVFGAISYRIHIKTNGRRIIRWRESSNIRAKQVFTALHEHLDDC